MPPAASATEAGSGLGTEPPAVSATKAGVGLGTEPPSAPATEAGAGSGAEVMVERAALPVISSMEASASLGTMAAVEPVASAAPVADVAPRVEAATEDVEMVILEDAQMPAAAGSPAADLGEGIVREVLIEDLFRELDARARSELEAPVASLLPCWRWLRRHRHVACPVRRGQRVASTRARLLGSALVMTQITSWRQTPGSTASTRSPPSPPHS